MYTNLLILGNGFDLDAGYKTRYSDFVNSRFWPFKEKDLVNIGIPNLRNFIDEYTEKHKDSLNKVLWIDIESMLREYALSKEEQSNFNEEIVSHDEETYAKLCSSFADYLRYELRDGTNNLNSLKASVRVIKAIANSTRKWIGYSFNYTDSANIVDFISRFGESEPLNIPFTHLHGRIQMHSGEDTLILGIDDVKIPSEYKFMRKSWNPNFASHRLNDDLIESDMVICFGLSLGTMDRDYFSDYFKSLINDYKPGDKKKEFNFITYDEASRISIMDNLEEIGAPMASLKKVMDINFYRTGMYGHSMEEMDRFNSLIKRLESQKLQQLQK